MDEETGLPTIDPDYPADCYNHDGSMIAGPGIGLTATQLPRFILETCRDADEAKRALLTTLHYHQMTPLHYIVGDRHGNGFVFEGLMQGNLPRFIDCGGAPLPVTNHPIREHSVSTHEIIQESVARLNMLKERLAGQRAPIARDTVRQNAEAVAAVLPAGEGLFAGEDPTRTMWHAFYDLEDRALTINYYLRDTGGKTAPQIHRSGDMVFKLDR
jgi:hypothetical protein